MLILHPDLINSCRVCRSPNQDGDYECLYQTPSNHAETPALSESGILYENLLDISLNVRSNYPQFLCNSCDLQMKLFKKLKDKAYKTLEYLQNLYGEELDISTENERVTESNECGKNHAQECEGNLVEYYKNEFDEYHENEVNECYDEFDEKTAENTYQSEYQAYAALIFAEDSINEYQEKLTPNKEKPLQRQCLLKEEGISNIEITNRENDMEQKERISIDSLDSDFKLNVKSTEEIKQTSLNLSENVPQVRLKFKPVIDKNDYVTEIYELLEDECKSETCLENNENIVEYDVHTEIKTETSSVFSDVDYIVDEEISNNLDNEKKQANQNSNPLKKRKCNNINKRNTSTNRKREYKCEPCQLEFKNLQEHKLHRTEVHNKKYPCNVCFKELKSRATLHHHMKIHNEQPAYQCEICQKTFNQKAHYQYHMNRHNNVRNFKCNVCEKAFLSKADLKVHLRFHTGQRPYVCNICGKDYLMMEHLKTHLLSHTEQYFECNVCNHKFSTHKTLRLHVKTIHEDEPKFKCNFCSKPFRRKHHLEYHLRLHQKNVNYLGSHYDIVDDPEVANYDSEQDFIDDPGFIALNE